MLVPPRLACSQGDHLLSWPVAIPGPREGLRAPPGPSPGAEGAQALQAGRVVRGLDTRGRLQNWDLRADCTTSCAWEWQPAQRGGVQGAAPMGPSSACASWSPPQHRSQWRKVVVSGPHAGCLTLTWAGSLGCEAERELDPKGGTGSPASRPTCHMVTGPGPTRTARRLPPSWFPWSSPLCQPLTSPHTSSGPEPLTRSPLNSRTENSPPQLQILLHPRMTQAILALGSAGAAPAPGAPSPASPGQLLSSPARACGGRNSRGGSLCLEGLCIPAESSVFTPGVPPTAGGPFGCRVSGKNP